MSLSRRRMEVVAHRGASGYAPENTLPAFALAVELGAAFIELDAHLSHDGEVVVIHDSTIDRTTGAHGAVGQLTLAELKGLDAGSWFNRKHPRKSRSEFAGLRIPTLQETVDLLQNTGVGLYVEVKDPDLYPPDFEEKIVALLERNRFADRSVLLSFSAGSIQRVRALNPALRTALLVGGFKMDAVAAAAAAGAGRVALRHTLLTPRIVENARRHALGIVAWTVNNRVAIRRMISLGVDAIITNYPDRPGDTGSRM